MWTSEIKICQLLKLVSMQVKKLLQLKFMQYHMLQIIVLKLHTVREEIS